MNANNRSPGPKNGNNDGGGGGTGGGGQARLPGIGGLFGEGFPTLKPAGTNRVPGKQISHCVFFLANKSCAMAPEGHIVFSFSIYSNFFY